MPRVTGPLFSAAASGAFAGIMEFRTVNGKAVVCAPKHDSGRGQEYRAANAARFKDAVGGWNALTVIQQGTWRTSALNKGMNGYQLYIREYLTQGIYPPNQPVLPP